MKIILISIVFILIYSCSHQTRKESVIAGYSVGPIMTHTIELFIDSTYSMSNGNSGRWSEINDTIFLIDNHINDSIAGLIVGGKALVNCPEYWHVEHFIYKRFDPPIVVDFPH